MSYVSFNNGIMASEVAPLIWTVSTGSSVASLGLLTSGRKSRRPVGAVHLIGHLAIQRWISSLLVIELL